MKSVYILSMASTVYGKISGALSKLKASDLASLALNKAIDSINKEVFNEIIKNYSFSIILGNVIQAGNGQNLARQVLFKTNLSANIPGFVVNQVCISPIKALNLAYLYVATGEYDIVAAGGVESMTNAPFISRLRLGNKYGDLILEDSVNTDGLRCTITNKLMIELADIIAKKYNITRDYQDELAYNSHLRANNAFKDIEFSNYFVGYQNLVKDENIRENISLEKLRNLKPVNSESITAGNASALADGASILILTNEEIIKKYNLKPLVRVIGFAEAFEEPSNFPIVPSFSTKKLLKKYNLSKEEIGIWEINEAFAAVLGANIKILELDYNYTNVFGGAVAFGHPVGATGARLAINSIIAMKKFSKNKALVMACAGSGGGYSMAIENI
jgi:acetyl-CoA C-acetyltransferase